MIVSSPAASTGRVRGRPFPINGAGTFRRGVPGKTFKSDETPSARQFRSMQRAAQRGVVAKLGIADHLRQLKSARADLSQQRQGEPPLFLEAHGTRNLRTLARLRREPRLGQIQRGAQHPGSRTAPQCDGHRDLAVGDLAQAAAVLPRDPDRVRPLLGKLVPSRISTPSRSGLTWRNRRQTRSALHGACVMKC
jgi:hypothetical protein